MFTRILSRSVAKQTLALGAATYATYSLARPVYLDGTFDKVKEAASDIGEKISSKSPLKPQSPAGIPGARTSHNPSTSMNHGQTAGESDDKQADPLVSAQKKRQKSSNNSTNNDDKSQTAKQGGGTGAKISSGHQIDENGQRVPNHDGIKVSSQPKKEKNSSKDGLNSTAASGMEEKVGEAKKEEAFNEETGEINWDCPCLGGMAHGPCGEDFKSAFSCFIYSKEEPKGSECLDAFKKMQSCFKEHEDIYGNLVDDAETPEGKIVA